MITKKEIDELGALNQEIARLTAAASKIKSAISAQGAGFYEGADFIAEVQEYDRATISPILVKEFGTSDFVAQVTQVQHVKAVVVKRVEL